ncbi:MAG: CxxC-x17-CxxC domain-containing protein [Patescibacteria group bacterium]
MGNFKRDGKRPGGGFSRKFSNNSFSDRDEGRPAMHSATCSECGVSCELPFRPSGDRPVFCSDCFGKQKGGDERPTRFNSDRHERPSFGDRRERSNFGDKPRYDAVCDKCGQSCQLPFRPREGKPVFCRDCFGKGNENSSKDSGNVAEQLTMLNSKIDKLIRILTPNAPVEKEKNEKPIPAVKTGEIKKVEIAEETAKDKKTKAKTATKKTSEKKKK